MAVSTRRTVRLSVTAAMGLLIPYLCLYVLFNALPMAEALKREVMALPPDTHSDYLRHMCPSIHVPPKTLVMGEYTISNEPHITTSVEVKDSLGNKHHHKTDQTGHHKFVFVTPDEEVEIESCFINTLAAGVQPAPQHVRTIEYKLDTGDDVREEDHGHSIVNRLRPVEETLKHLEKTMEEIVKDLDLLRSREAGMRDVNESTNSRVRFFSILSLLALVGSGVWQIWYLRQYFRTKKLI